MADNLFMSDYQKIIFANNINENTINGLTHNGQSINNIESLSKAYPFVVFVTNYNGENTSGELIRNIWVDGIRATRFVGVDPNSSITIGDRTIKLHFDYESGLLSLVDANKLESIQLIAYEYDKPYMGSRESTGLLTYNGIGNINAIDNKFKLVFRFILTDGGNIDVISKSLNIGILSNSSLKYFNIIGGPNKVEVPGYTNTSTDACFEYLCEIKYNNESSGGSNYIAISQYDNNINNQFKLSLRLNPIDYDIFLTETGEKINKAIQLQANSEYNFRVVVYPHGNEVNSYPISNAFKTLIFNVNSENSNYIQIINGESTTIQDNNDLKFKIKLKNSFGSSSSVAINCRLNNQDLISENEYYEIIKSFNVTLVGGTIYFYCGYVQPSSDSSFTSLMEDITTKVNNKDLNPLYDWNDNDWDVTDNSTQYFYIAFTEGYEDIILPCWDCYINNGSLKKYLPIEIGNTENDTKFRFNKINNNPAGITVYKGSIPGKFFGKIQIQNN